LPTGTAAANVIEAANRQRARIICCSSKVTARSPSGARARGTARADGAARAVQVRAKHGNIVILLYVLPYLLLYVVRYYVKHRRRYKNRASEAEFTAR